MPRRNHPHHNRAGAKAGCALVAPSGHPEFEGRKFVVIQENAGQRRVDVKLRIESEDRVEIASGLTEGQIVVGQ